jgi:hypothetical protein
MCGGSGWHPTLAGFVFAAAGVFGGTTGESHAEERQGQSQQEFLHAVKLNGIVSGASL